MVEYGRTTQDKILNVIAFIFWLAVLVIAPVVCWGVEIGDCVEGHVSYYTNASVDPRWGGITKSGEKFDEDKFTCAVLPAEWQRLKGKTIRVTNLDNFRSVEVKVNDTGGFKKYGRMVDLSKAAFEKIADKSRGLILARIEALDE